MVTVPNQKIIKIVHHKKKETEPFNIFTKTEMITAARLLNDRTASYILYCYLAMNKNGYTFALSPTTIEKEIGLTEKQYRKAVKRLEETRYLIKSGKNLYEFNTLPKNTDSRPLKVQTVSSSEYTPSTPKEIDGLPFNVERNIINNSISNIINNTVEKDFSYIDDFISKKEKIIADFNNEFGYLDDAYWQIHKEISILDEHIKNKSNIFALEESYKKLSEKIYKMRTEKKSRTDRYKTKLLRNIDKGDINTLLILKKYDEQHPPHRLIKSNKFVRWINGWNEDLQEPNIIYAPLTIGVDILKGTKHNITGIPKSYYLNK